jgi:hypothetical protein
MHSQGVQHQNVRKRARVRSGAFAKNEQICTACVVSTMLFCNDGADEGIVCAGWVEVRVLLQVVIKTRELHVNNNVISRTRLHVGTYGVADPSPHAFRVGAVHDPRERVLKMIKNRCRQHLVVNSSLSSHCFHS